jgi:hypothetical protein
MCFACASPFVERSCGTDCSATVGGHFIQIGGGGLSRSSVSFSSILTCGPFSHSFGNGGIQIGRSSLVNDSNGNFPSGHCEFGSTVYSNKEMSQFDGRYLTVAISGGLSGIDTISSKR